MNLAKVQAQTVVANLYWVIILSCVSTVSLFLAFDGSWILVMVCFFLIFFILLFPVISLEENPIPTTTFTQKEALDRRPGYVYVMQRDDGIIKIGCSRNPEERKIAHRSDYRKKFQIIALFYVPEMYRYEEIALHLTRKYAWEENKRRELRLMESQDLDNFINEFEKVCIKATVFRNEPKSISQTISH